MSIGPGGDLHTVTILDPPGDYEGNEDRYELECDVCDYIGAADTIDQAEAIKLLHEQFVAVIINSWGIDR